MAPTLVLQQAAALRKGLLRCAARASLNAASRQKLSEVGVPKIGRLFHTAVVRCGGNDSSRKMDRLDTFPPWKDGIDWQRGGGDVGGDEAARLGWGADADNWQSWTPEKMEEESNYLMRLNRVDLNSKENWRSYGFSLTDRMEDYAHFRFFSFLMVFQVIFVFFCGYYTPDFKQFDWVQREAHLELARREALGIPHIDPDYIPCERVLLPSDEELECMGVEPII